MSRYNRLHIYSAEELSSNFLHVAHVSMISQRSDEVVYDGRGKTTIELINDYVAFTTTDGIMSLNTIKKLKITCRMAIGYDKCEVVSHIVTVLGDTEQITKSGITLLMDAAAKGSIEIGQILIDKGANVNATTITSYKNTALIMAILWENQEFVEFLLQNHASVNQENGKGNTPLIIATRINNLDLIKVLHRYGGNLDSRNKKNVNCLMTAFVHQYRDVLQWLLEHASEYPNFNETVDCIIARGALETYYRRRGVQIPYVL